MKIKTLEGIDNKDILNVFNESFSDYFISFKLTQKQLTSKMLADKIDLNFSVGVFENKNLTAFILHGFDRISSENVIYNGGTGVIPAKRGAGLTKQMYQFILPLLKENGIDKIVLEVITENIPAINSYKKSGFIIDRELLCYKGEVSSLDPNNGLYIKKLLDYNWNTMESFWDMHPTWQNSNNVINELKDNNVSLGAYFENQLVGYIIFSPNNNRLQQIAVSKLYRQRRIASTLILEIIKIYGNTFSIINVDKRSKNLNPFLRKIGLKVNLEQLEMKLLLDEDFS